MGAPLQGRHALVTGAGRGIGAAIAARLVAEGARVTLLSRTQSQLDQVAAALGSSAQTACADITDLQATRRAFEQAALAFGPVDVLINNAAYRPIGPFLALTESDWDAVLSVNLLGAVRCCRNVLPSMKARKFGRVINVSGLDALWGWGNRAHVTVSKAGLLGLTRALAVEFADAGITVNSVIPGSFRTVRDPQFYPEWDRMRRYIVERTPLGRQGEPSELAEWCWFLASQEAGFVTGQDIHINGGAYPLLRNPLLPGD